MSLTTSLAVTDLAAIRANLDAVRSRVGDRLVLAAVKANAYGHGAVPVAQMIERTGSADWLGVATVAEGVQLREAGVGLPILKLSHAIAPDEADAAVRHRLTLAVVDADSIDRVAAAARAQGVTADVHLKVDTGMRRIGCRPDAAPALARRVDATEGVRLGGVFSHLPVSDTEAGRPFTEAQIAEFAAMVDAVTAARGRPEIVHLANSAAVLMHPDAWFDMVRPGIMLYGSLPDPTTDCPVELHPALRWVSQVTFVKRVDAGDTVGYGRTWRTPRDTMIGTVSVGYGDGFSRLFSSRGEVLIDGRRYPIVGRVCMDQFMIDLGPETAVTTGDEVVLIGASGDERLTPQDLADLMGTIPYEVTCLINARVERAFTE